MIARDLLRRSCPSAAECSGAVPTWQYGLIKTRLAPHLVIDRNVFYCDATFAWYFLGAIGVRV
jgi:hypothetical protein